MYNAMATCLFLLCVFPSLTRPSSPHSQAIPFLLLSSHPRWPMLASSRARRTERKEREGCWMQEDKLTHHRSSSP
jgi:hypothetical protein